MAKKKTKKDKEIEIQRKSFEEDVDFRTSREYSECEQQRLSFEDDLDFRTS